MYSCKKNSNHSPLLYNEYTYDQNLHLQAIGIGCYAGGGWVNSLSYEDDMVPLKTTVIALRTLLEVCHSYAGPHDIVYNPTKTVCNYVCLSDQSDHRVGTQQESGSEMRNLTL